MSEEKPDASDILQSAPPGTPSWSLGIGFFIAVILTNSLTLYLAVSPDVRQYLASKADGEKQERELTKSLSQDATQSILQIVATYSTQVAELSKSVGSLERDKGELTNKLANLQREVDAMRRETSLCEKELEACKTSRDK